jgi:hypothetical protein
MQHQELKVETPHEVHQLHISLCEQLVHMAAVRKKDCCTDFFKTARCQTAMGDPPIIGHGRIPVPQILARHFESS